MRFINKYYSLFFIFLITIGCNEIITKPDNTIIPITLDEVYSQKITTFVGKEIILKHKIIWESSQSSWNGLTDSTYVFNISINFEKGDNYLPEQFVGQKRGNILLESQNINKLFEGKQQYYYFSSNRLDSSMVYLLRGKIEYRDWINVDSTKLNDSIFIEQSNNVVYWSQTFQFNLISIDN